MKKGLICIALLASMALVSCGNQKWEYKVVKVAGEDNGNKYGAMAFSDPASPLNKLGADGWELVSSYTEENTVHPNFGNAEYVTGLQPNTRTTVINFVLKRKM